MTLDGNIYLKCFLGVSIFLFGYFVIINWKDYDELKSKTNSITEHTQILHGEYSQLKESVQSLIEHIKNIDYKSINNQNNGKSIQNDEFHSRNIRNGVPKKLLTAIEESILTQEQKEKHCHNDWFKHPSTLPYNLLGQEGKKYFSQEKQDEFVDKYFKGKRDGVFLEVGAVDGVTISNSLFFERERNWSGLLIEPNENFYKKLITVNRKAYTINTCLSLDGKINTANFLTAEMIGGVVDGLSKTAKARANHEYPDAKYVEVLCIPIFSILDAIKMYHIDLFSLDVEGAEMHILKTIPFGKVRIELFVIEYAISNPQAGGIDTTATKNKLREMQEFFTKLGTYKEIHRTFQDVVFARV